jgi:hypothetical protein
MGEENMGFGLLRELEYEELSPLLVNVKERNSRNIEGT